MYLKVVLPTHVSDVSLPYLPATKYVRRLQGLYLAVLCMDFLHSEEANERGVSINFHRVPGAWSVSCFSPSTGLSPSQRLHSSID